MVICEGGDTISENNYVIHSFKTVGVSTLKVIEGGLVEVLVVAGGGGGGNGNSTAMEAGGGGAGGLIYNAIFYITAPTNISVTVGAGGATGANGGNSIFSTLTAMGCGSGGSGGIQAGVGGSGGGGSYEKAGSAGTTGQGNSGGGGLGVSGLVGQFAGCGGGGGGAGNVGNTNYISFGGDGLYFPQYSNVGGSPPGWFAAGGQGGTVNVINKKYRSYGGGGYSCDVNGSESYPGIQNTGGGGGGRLQIGGSGAAGGSGIVIIRYKNYISQTVKTNMSDIQLAFGGTKPISASEYFANSTPNYTSNVRNIPNRGTKMSISQFRNNDNSINFKTYSYYGTINSNCNSIAIDVNSNIYFTDDTNYISKIDSSKTLTSTFYNIGKAYSKICILNNDLYLAYLYNDPNPAYWGSTQMTNNYVRIKKLTLTNGVVTTDVLFADKVHHSYIPGGDTSFWPSGYPGPITINPNGDVYIGINTGYWWAQQDIIKIASNGTKSIIYSYLGDAGGGNAIVYSLAPSNNSVGFYTIHQNNFNYMNDAGTITSLFSLGNPECRIVRYLSSRMIIFDRTSLIARVYDFNTSSIIETVSLYNVDFKEMCRSSINDVYIFNVKSQRILVRNCPNDGSSSKRAALSGWHLTQLNTSLNLQLTNGYYWIKGDKMPNALQMYVNFTADGGGYDFYVMTGATNVNYMYQRTGAENLGLDIFYPRSKAHWVAIYNFVVNVSGQSIATLVAIPGKVYRINGIGNYSGVLMRDPRNFSSGAPDWMVPDGGQWFIRDASYSEPNGNYYGYANLYTWVNRLLSDGTVEFDDGNDVGNTGTTILCSTNFKGSLFDVSTNDGSSSTKAALSGWHLAKYSKTYKLNLPSGTYWIKSPKMPNALQMYVNMTAEEGGYDFYRFTTATSRNYVTQDTGASALGLDLFYPRSKDHWAAIYDFVVNISGSTIANDIKTVGAVHRNGAGGNYTGTVMRSSVYYITGTTDWRVPDDGKWFIRDTTYVEPNGDYTANAFLGLIGLNSDGSVTGFNDGYDYNYYTGTTIICSTNVKGFSYYN
jgi:hypothetical protein